MDTATVCMLGHGQALMSILIQLWSQDIDKQQSLSFENILTWVVSGVERSTEYVVSDYIDGEWMVFTIYAKNGPGYW